MTDEEPWTGDVNETVREEWVEETSNFERVRQVLRSTTTFQYASEIAERARVSEPSARKHLQALAETGFAATDSSGHGTRYKRSREALAVGRIRDLHAELDREELVDGIQRLKSQIQSYQERHGVTDPDALALELDADDDGWEDISAWRAATENLDIAQAALSLYDFDPDGEDRTHGSSLGSLAEENDTLSA